MVTIDAVVIDYRAESLAVMLVVTKGIVKAKIGMEIEIDMVAVIDETSGTTIESKIGLAVPRDDHAVLLEPDRKENEMIDIKNPDLLLEVTEIETSNKSEIMLEIVRRIEREISENAAISTRILYRKVSR